MTLFTSGAYKPCNNDLASYYISNRKRVVDQPLLQNRFGSAGACTVDLDSAPKTLAQPQKFSVARAGKETVKGFFRPITTMIRHPFKTAFTLGATVAVAAAAPVTVPVMVAAGIGFGGLQTLRGFTAAIREAARGNYEASEKAFGNIGEGVFSLGSSLLGVRQAGAIAAEAKASRLALSAKTSTSGKLAAIDQGLKASLKVKSGSWNNALKETVSVFSPTGIKTIGAQLNPVRLGQLAKGQAQSIVGLFTESPLVDLKSSVQKAQRFWGIPDSQMPEIVSSLDKVEAGSIPLIKENQTLGYYKPSTHSIHVKPNQLETLRKNYPQIEYLPKFLQKAIANYYKNRFSMDEIMAHEMTHANQFLQIRQLSVPQARKILQEKFPECNPVLIEMLLKSFPLKGSRIKTFFSKPSEQAATYLKEQANFQIDTITYDLKTILSALKQDYPSLAKFNQKKASTYYWDGLEIEARQKAAEAKLADLIPELGANSGKAQEQQLLNQIRALKVEVKLNRLMDKIKRANSDFERSVQAGKLERQVQAEQANTWTQGFLRHEQQMKQTTNTVQAIQDKSYQAMEKKIFAPDWQEVLMSLPKRILDLPKRMLDLPKRVLNWFKGFFPLQETIRPYESLKPAYVTVNQTINQQGPRYYDLKNQ